MPSPHGIAALKITFDSGGNPRVIHPTLIWDEEDVVLVDAGFPGQLPLFREAIETLGIAFEKLNKIIITHQDRDHIGGLGEIIHALPHEVEVLSHGAEKPFIQGDETFVKKPSENKSATTSPHHSIPPFERVQVSRVIADGEELPYGGGVTVIHTPGHTLGHICLYHVASKTLVSGDAMNLVDGHLTGPNPLHTHDLPRAVESLKNLAEYDIERVICYHGGLLEGDANWHIAQLNNAGSNDCAGE
jgi:glyoxylase-like metal-dependent hydrolase (beta-lactamase superfamily II)